MYRVSAFILGVKTVEALVQAKFMDHKHPNIERAIGLPMFVPGISSVDESQARCARNVRTSVGSGE